MPILQVGPTDRRQMGGQVWETGIDQPPATGCPNVAFLRQRRGFQQDEFIGRPLERNPCGDRVAGHVPAMGQRQLALRFFGSDEVVGAQDG